MLLLKDGDESHYVSIKSMSALVLHRPKIYCTAYMCPHYIYMFATEKCFSWHLPDCSSHNVDNPFVTFPDEDKNEFYWKSESKTEFVTLRQSPVAVDREEGLTHVTEEHIPSCFFCYTVSQYEKFRIAPFMYSGRRDSDCMEVFI